MIDSRIAVLMIFLMFLCAVSAISFILGRIAQIKICKDISRELNEESVKEVVPVNTTVISIPARGTEMRRSIDTVVEIRLTAMLMEGKDADPESEAPAIVDSICKIITDNGMGVDPAHAYLRTMQNQVRAWSMRNSDDFGRPKRLSDMLDGSSSGADAAYAVLCVMDSFNRNGRCLETELNEAWAKLGRIEFRKKDKEK